MKDNKLISLLKTLDERQWEKLEQFIRSPYFNQDQLVLLLLEQLVKCLGPLSPTKNAPLPPKAEFAAQLWPGKNYVAKDFNYVLSKLNKLVEQFLVLERLQQSSLDWELAALDLFSELQLPKHYRATERSLRKKLATPYEDMLTTFKAKAQLAEIEDQDYLRQKRRVHDFSIQEAALQLDRSYFLRRLQLACSMLDRQHIFQLNYDPQISPAWIEHLHTHEAVQEPIIQLYLLIFEMLLEEQEESHFEVLTAKLKGVQELITPKDLTEIYQFAINYCARKIRSGREAYVGEALKLYLTGIDAGWLIINNELSPWTYANVVKLFLRQKRFTEAESFIQRYLPLLPERFRENAFHYNAAELYYYTSAYEKAQEHLIQVAYDDLNYYLGARVLLAKIYWQTEAEDALSSLLAAFMMFLQRNKQLSRDLKNTYLNFCKILARILRTNPTDRAHLQEVITATTPLTDRDWLLTIIQT